MGQHKIRELPGGEFDVIVEGPEVLHGVEGDDFSLHHIKL